TTTQKALAFGGKKIRLQLDDAPANVPTKAKFPSLAEGASVNSRLRALVLFLPFVLPLYAPAGVNIPTDCRVPNQPPGRCGWCALETLARHHGIKTLYGLVEQHPT